MGMDIIIKTADGDMGGYLARPAGGSGPGIVVIQEIFGVNADVRAKCDAWAAQGYLALAPDLFWRQLPGIQLTDGSPEEWQQAFALYQGFDVDKGVGDLSATIAALRAQPGCTGKIGAVGFCLGGLLAYLCATRTDVAASVGYYGVGIETKLGEAASIKAPLMLHIATADKYVGPEAQASIHGAFDSHLHVTLHDYAGQDHAFSRLNGEHYHEASAKLAHERTAALFASALA
jgi:carboxymethylenebutenolidase